MGNIIYLKVAKVGAQNADMTTTIERIEVTLDEGKAFNNFVKHLHVQNYILSEPPRVTKAVEVQNGKVVKELDIEKYQAVVSAKLESMKAPKKPTDYKDLAEKQGKMLAEMQERLSALEGGSKKSSNREAIEVKAKELDISFRSTISDTNLLKKINEIEPEFNV